METQEIANILRKLGMEPKLDHPMDRVGFWRLGGQADIFVKVPDMACLQGLLTLEQPVTVVGNGSNMLVSDRGIRGITIRLVGDFLESQITVKDGMARVCTGSGLLNTVLLRRMNKAGVVGLACLAGVPGTIGGAVRMNAGTSLGQLADKELDAIEVCTRDGMIHHRMRESLEFSYRWAKLPEGSVITRAWFSLDQAQAEETQEAIGLHLSRRMATQPLSQPSCGSVFKNPPGDYAGRLIEAAGLKGLRIGAAQISPRHANFIVNNGSASAQDTYSLILRARNEVWSQFGVLLEPEVHAVGDWPDGAWPLPDPDART